METITVNDRFSLEQACKSDQKVVIGDYGITCTLHRGIAAHESGKKLYTVGQISTGKAILTDRLEAACEKFEELTGKLPYLAKGA